MARAIFLTLYFQFCKNVFSTARINHFFKFYCDTQCVYIKDMSIHLHLHIQIVLTSRNCNKSTSTQNEFN